MTNKTKSRNSKIPSKNIRIVILSVVLWFIFWLPFQSMFIADIPFFSSLISSGDVTLSEVFTRFSLIIAVTLAISWLVYHKFIRDYGFLKSPKWVFLLYLLPLAAIVYLYINNPTEVVGVNTFVYIFFMVLSVAFQDILTFGFLQTTLEKNIGKIVAAIITFIAFYVGHLIFGFDLFILMYIVGFLIFAFSRYKTGAIYVVNVIHLTFVLVA